MLLRLLNNYAVWFIISVITCIIGYVVSLTYSVEIAEGFLVSYLWYFNGLLIPTSGYGALFFAIRTYKNVYHNLLNNILEIPNQHQSEIYSSFERLNSFWNKQKISIPVFLIGSAILYSCGYPLHGFPKFFLWITSSSMFYAGGLMIAYLYHSVLLFKKIESFNSEIKLQENTQILELENFNFYLSVLFLAGMIALYFAFRGTLTANFTFVPPQPIKYLITFFSTKPTDYSNIKKLLLYPIILFLPYAMFGGFYIRYVLRTIYLSSIKFKLNEIDQLTQPFVGNKVGTPSEDQVNRIIKIRTAVLELKDKIIQNNKVLPLINIKDSPSIILLLIIIIQFVYQNDKTIQKFISSVIGI